jgi:hypothetical protein
LYLSQTLSQKSEWTLGLYPVLGHTCTMDFVDKLVIRLERWRGEEVISCVRTPNGWRVYLTEKQLQHIRLESKHGYVTREKIERCLLEPTAIYLDVRPDSRGRKYWVVRQIIDPYGHERIKHFSVDVKQCRKMLLLPVMFVSTAHNLDRFRNAKGKRIWPKASMK